MESAATGQEYTEDRFLNITDRITTDPQEQMHFNCGLTYWSSLI